MTPVQHGVEASTLPGATVFGTTPATTPETVSFFLQERNEPQFESAVEHGVRQFDSVGQFASTYGQSPSNISQLERYLAGYGIKTFAYSDDVDVSASGTAGQFDSALAVQQFRYHVPSRGGHNGLRPVPAQNVHGPSRAPELPSQIAQYVLAVLGLSNYAPFSSQAVHAPDAVAQPSSLNPTSCDAISGTPAGCNTPADFDANYGLTSLIHHGATGQGRTLAIVTLAALDPGAPQYFW